MLPWIVGIAGVLMLMYLSANGVELKYQSSLLKACPEQESVEKKREFVCTVPVQVKIKDGAVDEVIYPRVPPEKKDPVLDPTSTQYIYSEPYRAPVE